MLGTHKERLKLSF